MNAAHLFAGFLGAGGSTLDLWRLGLKAQDVRLPEFLGAVGPTLSSFLGNSPKVTQLGLSISVFHDATDVSVKSVRCALMGVCGGRIEITE